MRQIYGKLLLVTLLVVANVPVGAPPAFAQALNTQINKAQGESWDTIAQLPNWDGVWQSLLNRAGAGQLYKRSEMPFTPEWKKKVDALDAVRKRGGDVEARGKYCLFFGSPGGMAGPQAFHEFVYTPGQVTVFDEQGYMRRIYTDGRKHHVGPPTLWGDSIGHWEGNSLVVDTINMQAGNEIDYGMPGGKNMHLTERIHFKDNDPSIMVIDEVIEAPQAFTRPYRFSVEYGRREDGRMIEFDCAQNNRDLTPSGGQTIDMLGSSRASAAAPLIPKSGRGSHKHDGE